MCSKFEDNMIVQLCFVAIFYKYEKGKEKTKKMSNFLCLYIRNGWRKLLQIWYVLSPDMPALAL